MIKCIANSHEEDSRISTVIPEFRVLKIEEETFLNKKFVKTGNNYQNSHL